MFRAEHIFPLRGLRLMTGPSDSWSSSALEVFRTEHFLISPSALHPL